MHVLDRPAAVDELRSQPIEQRRVGAGLAGFAEVVRRRDEAAPEVELPNAVDHHAGCQRMPGAGDPLGQREPPAGRERVRRLGDGRLGLGQDLEKFRLHFFAGPSGVAADQQVRVHRFGAVFADGYRVFAAVPRWLGVLRFVRLVLPRKNFKRRDERRVGGGVPFVLGLVVEADVPEEGQHLVVVPLRDGIEHVIMATRAANRQAHEGFRRGLEHVVEPFELGGARVVRFVIPDTEPVKTGGDQAVIVHVRQLVAGDLLHHEPVVRLVLVERADDVVAVFPDKRFFIVALVAVGLGEAHDVEPMAAPAFAVLRQAEQMLDEPWPGVGRVVVHERLHLAIGRRQADEVKVRAANERGLVGDRVRGDTPGVELRLDQLINRRLVAVALGQARTLDRAERPVVTVFIGD